MRHLIKCLSILFALFFLTITCIFPVAPVFAQTHQKPSAPEFSLKFIPASETITHTDPYTGEKTYEIVDKSTIDVKIKNQPFKENINGIKYYLFYTIEVQGHFSQSNSDMSKTTYYNFYAYSFNSDPGNKLQATNSEYTTASIKGNYPSHAQIDVTVNAMLMYEGEFTSTYSIFFEYTDSGVVPGEKNQSVQTFTIPKHQNSAYSPDPTIISTQPHSSITKNIEKDDIISISVATFIAIIAIFLSIITLLLALILFKIRKPQQQ